MCLNICILAKFSREYKHAIGPRFENQIYIFMTGVLLKKHITLFLQLHLLVGMRDTCYRALNERQRLVGLKGEGKLFSKRLQSKARGRRFAL